MYERFTDRARKVMQLANQEAQQSNHEYIGTEHVLLGLINEGSGVAANALKKLNVDVSKIRIEVEKIGNLPQWPRAKMVIENSMKEANDLNHDYIGTEHILLGLIRDQNCVGSQVLVNLGLQLADVRREVIDLLGVGSIQEPAGRSAYERFSNRARKIMQLANQEAQRFNHTYIGTEHVLLGLIKDGCGVAANVLENLDIDPLKIRLEVEKLMLSGPDTVTMGKLPQTPRAKKVIEYSIEEARNLKHDYVGTEHILLGLIREQEGVASQVLMNLGLKLGDVREEVRQVLGCGSIRTTERRRVSKVEIQDLPAELRQTAVELDTEIRRLTLEKEAGVAEQDFEKAARLRDQVDKLKKRKKVVIRDWIVNRSIDASWLSFNGGLVTRTAQIINDERRWEDLPALADYLEAAGCTDAEMLEHCRGASAHTSHCWVLDVLLANVSGAADE
jgi:ATP-dependent Clp protease ATP-binding subunit ClpA